MSGFKDFINKITSNQKIRKYMIIGLLGVMLMIGASTIFDTDEPSKNPDTNNDIVQNNQKDDFDSAYKNKRELEKDIEKLLARIENAGKVTVVITYENNGEIITEKDISEHQTKTTEDDGQGGKRNIDDYQSDSKVVYSEGSNSKAPFVKSEVSPKIRGVAVVAEGGNDEVVVAKITDVLQVLLDVPVHKIKVTR